MLINIYRIFRKPNFHLMVYLWLLMITVSCKSSSGDSVRTVQHDGLPQLLFLNYMLYKSSQSSPETELINKIIADGSMKDVHPNNHPNKEGDLICYQLDELHRTLSEQTFANPLIKNIEYVTKNNQLAIKQIDLDSAHLSIRLQLLPKTRFIKLEIIENESMKNTTLITTKVK